MGDVNKLSEERPVPRLKVIWSDLEPPAGVYLPTHWKMRHAIEMQYLVEHSHMVRWTARQRAGARIGTIDPRDLNQNLKHLNGSGASALWFPER